MAEAGVVANVPNVMPLVYEVLPVTRFESGKYTFVACDQ